MTGPDSRTTSVKELLLALVRIFLPGLFATPLLFLLVFLIVGAAGSLVMWTLPQLRSSISESAIVFAAIAAVSAALALQLHRWWSERNELQVTTNGVVVVIFTLYVALAVAGIRYAIYSSDRTALQWSEEIAKARWKEVASRSTAQLEDQPLRDAIIADMYRKVAQCNLAVVASLADHYRYARGRTAELLRSSKQSNCTVWVWVDSALTRLLPNPRSDQETVIQLQRGTIDGRRIWFSDKVGLVPENLPDVPSQAFAALERAYTDPHRIDLNELLAIQSQHERNRRHRLEAELQAARESRGQPSVAFAQFALASIGQFVGAFGDMVKPVSIPAQILDIFTGFLRTLFTLVFFERLVNSRRVDLSSGSLVVGPHE